MDSRLELPITGVCIVSDPNKTPPNYTVIDKTHDRSEDADLWKDGLFGKRTMRYLCVERRIPDQTKDVLVDVMLINEKDLPPPGFTVVETTHDTREKAMKKKLLCLRWTNPIMVNDAITELIFLSRASRKPPIGYKLVGDTNNLSLCFKTGNIMKPAAVSPVANTTQIYPSQPYSMNALGKSLPYEIPSENGMYRPVSNTLSRTGPPEQSANSLATATVVSPLSGIPWQLNSKFQHLVNLQNVTMPDIRCKSMMEIEREYEYDFSIERNTTRGELRRS